MKNETRKICRVCSIEQPVSNFYKRGDGFRSECKECTKLRIKKWNADNSEWRKLKSKERYESHKEERKKQDRERYQEKKEEILRKNKEYQEANKETMRLQRKKYREANKEKIKDINKKYYEDNKARVLDRQREYYKENKEKVKEYCAANADKIKEKRREYNLKNKEHNKKYRQNKMASDELFNMADRARSRITQVLRRNGFQKKCATSEMLGCDWITLKEHIENKFQPGMTWENRAEWHIDHIIPLSRANNEGDLSKLCHYTNLQPLWATDNLKKSNKIMR